MTREIDVDYAIKHTRAGFKIDASFDFDVTEHGITIPSYLGVTIEPAMRAEVSMVLVDAP